MENVFYPSRLETDSGWGILCTGVGKKEGATEPESATSPKDEYRLIYFTEGQGLFRSSTGASKSVGEGDIVLLFPGENYLFTPSEGTAFSESWVSFWGNGHIRGVVADYFDKTSPVLSIGASDTVFDLYGRLTYLAKSEKVGSQEAMGGFIYALLGYIYHKVASLSVSRLKNVEKIQQARMMIRNNLSSKISPAEIASRLGMSYSLLREQFKAITGVSMAGYLLNQRMNLAKTLLSSSDKSIKEIAFETGYESLSRFCYAFHQATGVSASEFRHRKEPEIN